MRIVQDTLHNHSFCDADGNSKGKRCRHCFPYNATAVAGLHKRISINPTAAAAQTSDLVK